MNIAYVNSRVGLVSSARHNMIKLYRTWKRELPGMRDCRGLFSLLMHGTRDSHTKPDQIQDWNSSYLIGSRIFCCSAISLLCSLIQMLPQKWDCNLSESYRHKYSRGVFLLANT